MVSSSAPRPKVSVLMLAYNHGRYIRQAVESALAQRTTFPVEIVVGEDCSTDDTRAVLQDLVAQYPNRVRVLLRPRNLGAGANVRDTFTHCRGEFIAALEGDDFWNYPEKLQQQVDFLEQHPDCALVFHDAWTVDAATNQVTGRCLATKPAPFSTTAQLLAGNFVVSCSVVYRRRSLPAELPAYFLKLPMQDWPTWVLASLTGKVAYLDETWASYRHHAGGVWSTTNYYRRLVGSIRFYRAIRSQLPPDLAAQVRELLAAQSHEAAWICLDQNRRWEALAHLGWCLRTGYPCSPTAWMLLEAAIGRRGCAAVKHWYRRLRGLEAS